MIQELLYTSHKGDGLRAGTGGGFCTVLCTHGMAPNLVRRLEQMSGYSHPFDMHDERALQNPTLYQSMPISIGGTRYVVLSRIADLRAEHSGRSNKLAHHLLLTEDEFTTAGPAAVLGRSGALLTKFDGDVREVAPKSSGVLTADSFSGPCQTWAKVAGDAGWAGAVADRLTKRGSDGFVKVIFPLGTDCLTLVDEVFSLLPSRKKWSTSFSTFATGNADPANLEFILNDTREATLLRRDRRKFIVDLAANLGAPEASARVEAARSGDRSSLDQPVVSRKRRSAEPVASGRKRVDDDDLIEVNDDSPGLMLAPPELDSPPIRKRKPQRLEVVEERKGRAVVWIGVTVALLLTMLGIGLALWLFPQGSEVADVETVDIEEVSNSHQVSPRETPTHKAPESEVATLVSDEVTDENGSNFGGRLTSDNLQPGDPLGEGDLSDKKSSASDRPEAKEESDPLRKSDPPEWVSKKTNIPWAVLPGEVKRDKESIQVGKIWDESVLDFEVCVKRHLLGEIDNFRDGDITMKFNQPINDLLQASAITPLNLELKPVGESKWIIKLDEFDVASIFVKEQNSKPASLFFQWGEDAKQLESKYLCIIPFLQFDIEIKNETVGLPLKLREKPFNLSYSQLDEANRLIAYFHEYFKPFDFGTNTDPSPSLKLQLVDRKNKEWNLTNNEDFEKQFNGYSFIKTGKGDVRLPLEMSLSYRIKNGKEIKSPVLAGLNPNREEYRRKFDGVDESLKKFIFKEKFDEWIQSPPRTTSPPNEKAKEEKLAELSNGPMDLNFQWEQKWTEFKKQRSARIVELQQANRNSHANIAANCTLVDQAGEKILSLLEVKDTVDLNLEITAQPIGANQ